MYNFNSYRSTPYYSHEKYKTLFESGEAPIALPADVTFDLPQAFTARLNRVASGTPNIVREEAVVDGDASGISDFLQFPPNDCY